MPKTLVLYVFNKKTRLVESFFKNCIFEDNDTHFLVITNGYTENLDDLPSYVTLIRRENKGYDFGGWSHALLTSDLYKNYDYFIFANASIFGPFLRPDFKGKWTDIFINGLTDDIKLFGSTINTMFKPETNSHVQTYIFSINRETLDFLIEKEIFSFDVNSYANQRKVIDEKEIKMSRLIIENGGNIGALSKFYRGVDFRFKEKKPEDYSYYFCEDIAYPFYKDKFWTVEEVVFIKGNRFNLE